MTLLEAIDARHSVRRYTEEPIAASAVEVLKSEIAECNKSGRLICQLVLEEPKGFTGILSYGKFSGVRNYIVMAGEDEKDLDERIGYYGERLVLMAQQLGLSTCWVGLSYRKVKDAYSIRKGDKIKCVIAVGYAAVEGHGHKVKAVSQVSNAGEDTPEWFVEGVKAALKAPTAINQQKFYFEYKGQNAEGKHLVEARRGFSLTGYTQMDLGIVKQHFEIAAGKDRFVWC